QERTGMPLALDDLVHARQALLAAGKGVSIDGLWKQLKQDGYACARRTVRTLAHQLPALAETRGNSDNVRITSPAAAALAAGGGAATPQALQAVPTPDVVEKTDPKADPQYRVAERKSERIENRGVEAPPDAHRHAVQQVEALEVRLHEQRQAMADATMALFLANGVLIGSVRYGALRPDDPEREALKAMAMDARAAYHRPWAELTQARQALVAEATPRPLCLCQRCGMGR